MATFVKLTRPDGKATYVCPDQVCAVDYPIAGTVSADTGAVISLINGKLQAVIEDLPIVVALLRNPDA